MAEYFYIFLMQRDFFEKVKERESSFRRH